jgi:hypothetical protein
VIPVDGPSSAQCLVDLLVPELVENKAGIAMLHCQIPGEDQGDKNQPARWIENDSAADHPQRWPENGRY